MQDNNPSRDPDELVSRWLDEFDSQEDLSSGLLEDLPAAERRRVADLQLLHSLLVHVHDQDADRKTELVQSVMRAIEEDTIAAEDPAPAPPERLISVVTLAGAAAGSWQGRLVSFAIAASLLIAGFLWWNQPENKGGAQAAVNHAIRVVEQPIDRTYRLRVQVDEMVELEASLYVRGREKFVLKHPGPVMGEVMLGSNGKEAWFVPMFGPVLINENPWLLQEWMQRRDMVLPFVQFSDTLTRITDHYDLKIIEADQVPEGTRLDLRLIRARRRPDVTSGPAVVELLMHRESGVVHRLDLWSSDEEPFSSTSGRRLTIELVEQQPLDDDWYEHQAHHDPMRPVRRLPIHATDSQ